MAGMTLPQAVERVRQDIGDTDQVNAALLDEHIERAIERALRELSIELPQQMQNTITTSAGFRYFSIAALTEIVRIVAVEWPAGNYPPTYVRFSIWQTTLTMLVPTAPAGVENVTVFWEAQHKIDGTGTTLPTELEELLLTGAEGYALQQLAASTVNAINTGGAAVTPAYRQEAGALLRQFRQELRRLGRRGSVRTSRLYTPDRPISTQTTDAGPP